MDVRDAQMSTLLNGASTSAVILARIQSSSIVDQGSIESSELYISWNSVEGIEYGWVNSVPGLARRRLQSSKSMEQKITVGTHDPSQAGATPSNNAAFMPGSNADSLLHALGKDAEGTFDAAKRNTHLGPIHAEQVPDHRYQENNSVKPTSHTTNASYGMQHGRGPRAAQSRKLRTTSESPQSIKFANVHQMFSTIKNSCIYFIPIGVNNAFMVLVQKLGVEPNAQLLINYGTLSQYLCCFVLRAPTLGYHHDEVPAAQWESNNELHV
jgi:hypothetical protein